MFEVNFFEIIEFLCFIEEVPRVVGNGGHCHSPLIVLYEILNHCFKENWSKLLMNRLRCNGVDKLLTVGIFDDSGFDSLFFSFF